MMRRVHTIALVCAIGLSSCDIQQVADAKFGDQHFKTAISLIELHKVRTGAYPSSLKALRFIGDWDALALSSVDYTKLDAGYELNVVRGWVSTPQLQYPPAFWQGLGVVRSNLKATP